MGGNLDGISELFPRPKRLWDSYGAYLFDIDGTLIRSHDRIHHHAFLEALKLLAGRPLNLHGVLSHGNTDTGILRDALTLGGVPESVWRPRLKKGTTAMCAYVKQHRKDLSIEVLPCVPRLLSRLHARGAVLGVATGNLEGIGRLKLKTAMLLDRFDFGVYSDGCESREEVFRQAARKARSVARSDVAVCAVGDTPADILAARANDLGAIAVATGSFSLNELAAQSPDWLLGTLEELLAGLPEPDAEKW